MQMNMMSANKRNKTMPRTLVMLSTSKWFLCNSYMSWDVSISMLFYSYLVHGVASLKVLLPKNRINERMNG